MVFFQEDGSGSEEESGSESESDNQTESKKDGPANQIDEEDDEAEWERFQKKMNK